MNLVKEHWNKKDIEDFQEYLKTYDNPLRREWCTNILKTELPVLCMKTADFKDIVKDIYKGNYIEFLDYMLWDYYENTVINGSLISMIKDFDLRKKYLDIYSKKSDNWATCDLLKFNVKGNEQKYYDMVLEYTKSDKPFVRRIGLYILFDFINDEYIDRILNIIDSLKDEEHYYVNMMSAWLLCECFIKERDKTLAYLENNKLNKFVINKAIQKCRESYRVTKDDKDLLLKFKRK